MSEQPIARPSSERAWSTGAQKSARSIGQATRSFYSGDSATEHIVALNLPAGRGDCSAALLLGFQRVVPLLGGVDISPVVAILVILGIELYLLPALHKALASLLVGAPV